jgi:hypothetical protein
MRAELQAEMERIRASFRAEIVPYRPTAKDVVRARPAQPPPDAVRRIAVERDDR